MSDRLPPENAAIIKALEVAGNNPELIQLTEEKVQYIIKLNKLEAEMQSALKAINDTYSMANYVRDKKDALYPKCWDGTITEAEIKMLRPGYFNYQDLLAQRKLKEIDKNIITDKMQNITMVYDVNEKSEFIRAYLSNGKQLNTNNPDDKKIIDLFDQCFHSWLVANNMSSQNGVIFNTSKLGKTGNYSERANSADVVNLLNDSARGLNASVKKQAISLDLKVQRFQQSEPGPAIQAEKSA